MVHELDCIHGENGEKIQENRGMVYLLQDGVIYQETIEGTDREELLICRKKVGICLWTRFILTGMVIT